MPYLSWPQSFPHYYSAVLLSSTRRDHFIHSSILLRIKLYQVYNSFIASYFYCRITRKITPPPSRDACPRRVSLEQERHPRRTRRLWKHLVYSSINWGFHRRHRSLGRGKNQFQKSSEKLCYPLGANTLQYVCWADASTFVYWAPQQGTVWK